MVAPTQPSSYVAQQQPNSAENANVNFVSEKGV